MAGGIDRARGLAIRRLRLSVGLLQSRLRLLTLTCVLGVVACGGADVPPTLAPAPTLVVVTATPGPPAVPTPGVQQRYVVQEGDTLSGIAARFGVSEESILKQNAIQDPNRLLAGQELIIPAAQP
jgi:LysM repeat protein